MKISVITDEMSSPALKEIVGSVHECVEAARGGKKSYRHALIEVTAHKHILQAFIFDRVLAHKQAVLERDAS